MAKKKIGLGRGLAELLGEGGQEPQEDAGGSGGRVVDLPVGAVRPNPRQPRRSMDAEALEELARSIASAGMVQPVIVRSSGDEYELIAGERRWRAAQMAGFTVVPAIVREASDVESLELALVENVVRQELNPVDEAYALRVLSEDLGVTQELLADRVGRSRSAIANKLRLLELPEAVQEFLASGELAEGHGRALLGLESRGERIRLARRAVKEGLSVRYLEAEVRKKAEGARGSKASNGTRGSSLPSGLVDEVKERFYGAYSVVPRVKARGKGGVIEVPFKDQEELERILRCTADR